MIDLTKEWSITLNDRVIYEKVDIVVLPNELLMVLHQDIVNPLMFISRSQCSPRYLGELDTDGDSIIDEEYELESYCEIVKKADKRKSNYEATLNSLAKIVERL